MIGIESNRTVRGGSFLVASAAVRFDRVMVKYISHWRRTGAEFDYRHVRQTVPEPKERDGYCNNAGSACNVPS